MAVVTRRSMLIAASVSLASACIGRYRPPPGPKPGDDEFEIVHTREEWQRLLTPAQFDVLRDEVTEAPYSSALLHEERAGVFACAGCVLGAFLSAKKFDSKTGWPSFTAAIDGAVGEARDESLGMVRTAVYCHRCGGHLGHLFDDGPWPSGLRYCINGAALIFTPS